MRLVYPFNGSTRDAEEFEKNCVSHMAEKLPTFYAKFEAWLALHGKTFLVKDAPSTADFHLWEMLDQHEIIAQRKGQTSPLVNFPKLKAYYDAFRALPQLEKYFAGDAYALAINSAGSGAYIY